MDNDLKSSYLSKFYKRSILGGYQSTIVPTKNSIITNCSNHEQAKTEGKRNHGHNQMQGRAHN